MAGCEPQRMFVIGDAMVDVVASLGEQSVQVACAAGHVLTDVRTQPAGTGVVVALAGRRVGIPTVGLWTSVGVDRSGAPDAGALAVRALLREAGVEDLVRQDHGLPTGTALCVGFADDERLLLVNPGANASVDQAGPSARVRDFVDRCDVLYLSGYALQFADRARQVNRLVDSAAANGACVVLDLVPHRLERTSAGLVHALDRAEVVIGEAHTVRHVYGLPIATDSDEDVEGLADVVVGNHSMAVIRQNNNRELRARAGGPHTWHDTGYGEAPATERTGYLDRLAVQVFTHWLTDGR